MKSYRVIYSGKVQGIGFRYTVKRIADKYNIVGWVRNLSDGSVEVFVQGEELTVLSFLQGVESYFKDNIRDKKKLEEIVADVFGFQIRY
ncbi:MAG: acylphosphatase [Candidatus Margulisbacteria bacterium]|nr:acylphosphatase [Candidatus Margulisiibacteriota bacterium]